VGGDPNSRGVVAACSYEARKYGLHSAMPIKTAFKLCPHGIYLHGSHKEYTRFSKNVKKILENYSPMIEQTSIDEFFMDFTGCEYIYGSLFMFASKLQREIWDKLSLPCSIGIGSNKNVAKIGSDCMKPKGITYIIPGYEKEFLAPMPISVIPGVGKVTERTLNSKGFYIISDIQNTPQDYFSLLFGKYGISLWNRANGEGSELLTLSHKRKSISKETTFEIDVVDKNELEMVLFNLVSKVGQSIRNKNWQTSTVGIKLRYSDFGTIIRDKTITATDDDKIIYENVVKLFRNNYNRRVGIRLIGVHTTNFSEAVEQEFLFEDSRISRKKMLKAVQKIRDKYGFEVIVVGGNESKNIR